MELTTQISDNDDHMITDCWIHKFVCQQQYHEAVTVDWELMLSPYVKVKQYMRRVSIVDGDLKSTAWIPANHDDVPPAHRAADERIIHCDIEDISILLNTDIVTKKRSSIFINKPNKDPITNEYRNGTHSKIPGYINTGIDGLWSFQLTIEQRCNIGRFHKRPSQLSIDTTYKLQEGQIEIYFDPNMEDTLEYWKTLYNDAMPVTSGVYNGGNLSNYVFNEIGGIEGYLTIKYLITDSFTSCKHGDEEIVGFIYEGRGYNLRSFSASSGRIGGELIDKTVFFDTNDELDDVVIDIYKSYIKLMRKNILYIVRDKVYLNGDPIEVINPEMFVSEFRESLKKYITMDCGIGPLTTCYINIMLPEVLYIQMGTETVDVYERKNRCNQFKEEIPFILDCPRTRVGDIGNGPFQFENHENTDTVSKQVLDDMKHGYEMLLMDTEVCQPKEVDVPADVGYEIKLEDDPEFE